MKRQRVQLEDIAAMPNLMLAVYKAARGKHARRSVARVFQNLESELSILSDEILTERAPRGRFRQFMINDPKKRLITAACFEDRILHHAILNLTESRFEKMMVDSSYACRRGKGVHRAVARVQQNLRKHSNWPWIVKVDIDGYFPSVEHARVLELLGRMFKGDPFLRLLARILTVGSTSRDGVGLPIGSLTSQHFANVFLDGADRYLLGPLRACAHVRYMDDILWWCRSRTHAEESLMGLQDYLWSHRRLRLKDNVYIGHTKAGLAFCGFRVRPGVVLASSRKMSRYRLGRKRIEWLFQSNLASALDAQRGHDLLLASLHGTCSVKFRRSFGLGDVELDSYNFIHGCESR